MFLKDLLFEYSYLIALYGSPIALCFSLFSLFFSFKKGKKAISEDGVRGIVHEELSTVRHNVKDLVAKVDMLILKVMKDELEGKKDES